MKVQIISLFPEMFDGVLNASMLHKAQDKKIVNFSHINLRDFGLGPRRQVDDTPYGGGDGMLLMPEPLFAAVEKAKSIDKEALVYLMTPKGEKLTQSMVRKTANENVGMVIICARYEGYDERVTSIVDRQVSIGNYILTGGELPAMVFIDSVVRLLPGVLGGQTSTEIESFSQSNILEFPQYTKPEVFRGLRVPKVLLSGNHAEIQKWRDANSQNAKD